MKNRKGVIFAITVIFEDSAVSERCIGTYDDALTKAKEVVKDGCRNPEKIIAINITKQSEL